MKILIVDDCNDKIASIAKTINEVVGIQFEVDTVIDLISALSKIKEQVYDLMIVDLLLPVRSEEDPIENGGMQLIQEIERKSPQNTPRYIVGLTQHEELSINFSEIWKVLHFSPVTNWKSSLKHLVKHVDNCTNYETFEIKPVLYVEGKTDKEIFLDACRIFNSKIQSQVNIKTVKGAGAKWVANQVVAWAHLMQRDSSGTYHKCMGLLDGDAAGLEAKQEINRIIPNESALRETFNILCLSPDFARDIIPIRAKGLKIPVTLEELFSTNEWQYAKDQNWLEIRNDPDSLLEDPTGWNKYEQTLMQYIESRGINHPESLFLSKVNSRHKDDFKNYILGLPDSEKPTVYKNFPAIITKIEEYLLN